MWPRLLELCADVLAGTNRRNRVLTATISFAAAVVITLVFLTRWGLEGLAPLAVILVLTLGAARDVFAARDRLWCAATLPLDDKRQQPVWTGDERTSAPTAIALNRLALATDAARRGRYVEASEHAGVVARELLRPEEIALLEAVRSMVSLGLGDVHRAAQLAVLALPTGGDDIDTALGRAVVADAWADKARLAAVDSAWSDAGVETAGPGTLPRLRRLVRVRIDESLVEHLRPADAAALSDEARAIGDDDLAAELGAVARRSGTYR
jgi:hypothetical protein